MTMDLQDNKQNLKSPPDKWRKKYSKSRPGKHYFYNVKTNETAWTLPAGAVLEEFSGSSQDDTKAGSKRKSKSVIPVPAKKENKIVQPIQTGKSVTLPRGSQRNNDKLAVKEEEQKKICTNTTTYCEDVAPAKIRPSRLQESVPSNGQSLVVQPSTGVSQAECISAPQNIPNKRRKQRKRKKKKSIDSTGTISQITCEREGHPVPSSIKLGSKQDLTKSSPSIRSSTVVTALSGTFSSQERALVQVQPDIPQSNFKSNQHQSPSLPVTEKICVNIPCNTPMKLKVHDSFKEINENDHDISDKKTIKTPAQARLKRLQRSHPEKLSKEKILKGDDKASIITGGATKRLAQLQAKLQSNVIYNKILQDNVMHVEKEFDNNSSKSSQFAPYVPNNLDCMDVEYMESEVLEDIDSLRQDSQELSHPSMFMEVDINLPLSPSGSLYIVLDTNILLSHLKFVEGLRDTILQGNVFIHLYLPWQVLQELDHLKDKGKRNIPTLARSAIKFLHDNFSHKHPRVCGQKLSEATKRNFSTPDDSILQSCIQLKEEGYPVVLLSNDINLCNKALVCDVKALSKDQFVKEYTDSSDCLSSSVEDKKKLQTSTPDSDVHDVALCKMKALTKDTLGLVVSKGMEDVYGHLWKKRSLISPPWEVDDVLRCLDHHWFSVCDTFIPNSVREIIRKLRDLIKNMSKGGTASVLELTEAFELIILLIKALPTKYSSLVQVAIENAKVLKSSLDKNSTLVESAKAPNHSDQLLGNQCPTVLFCFEQAYSAAQSLCNSEPFADPDWIPKAQAMLQSVQQLIHLIKLVLSLPVESLSDKTIELKELASLIGGTSSITSGDLAEFCMQNQNRILLENGIHQFISFENLLSNKLQLQVI